MQETKEIRICDMCKKEQSCDFNSIGGGLFPTWFEVVHGRGLYTQENHDFCSLDCLLDFVLKDMIVPWYGY